MCLEGGRRGISFLWKSIVSFRSSSTEVGVVNSWEGKNGICDSTTALRVRIIDKKISWELRVKTQELGFLV